MPFLNKEDLQATIQAYNIDVEGLSFPQQQGRVTKYLAAHGLEPVHKTGEKPDDFAAALQKQFAIDDGYEVPEEPQSNSQKSRMVLVPEPEEIPQYREPVVQAPVIIRGKAKRVQLDLMNKQEPPLINDQLRNKRLVYSPEIRFQNNMIYRYEEDLGEDVEVEELWYNGETLDQRHIQAAPGESNGVSGTYNVKLKPGSKVTAVSSLPRTNAGIYWDFDKDGMPMTPFPIATFEGRKGYLYSHATIPCVLDEIKRSGYYQDFKDQLKDEPQVFYLAGSIRAIDIEYCHWLMHEIEDRERYKRGTHIR